MQTNVVQAKVLTDLIHAFQTVFCYAGPYYVFKVNNVNTVLREYYLKAMGIVSWKKRLAPLQLPHYVGLAADHRWLLLASVKSPQADCSRLVEAIGRVLSIQQVRFSESLAVPLLSEEPFQRLLLLGDDWVDALPVSQEGSVCHDKPCVIGPALDAMLAQPLLKQDLWQQLRPLLQPGVH